MGTPRRAGENKMANQKKIVPANIYIVSAYAEMMHCNMNLYRHKEALLSLLGSHASLSHNLILTH